MMEQLTFTNYLSSILKTKKISLGLFGDVVSIFLAIIQAPSVFVVVCFVLGTLLVLWGVFEYTNFLYNKYVQKINESIKTNVGFKESAESVFRGVREILKAGMATSELIKLDTDIKFVGFAQEQGKAMVLLHIKGISQIHVFAQIECIKQETIVVEGKKILVDSPMGILKISKIEKKNLVVYCEMIDNENENWHDIIIGVQKGHQRLFPKKIAFKPSSYESLDQLKPNEMKKLYDLIGKFSRF